MYIGSSDYESVNVDGIGGIGNQNRIAWLGHGQGQVGESLLGADGGDYLALLIQLDVETAFVEGAQSLTQTTDTPGKGVSVVAAVVYYPAEFIDYMGRGGLIGVAHAEVDDILAALPGCGFQFIDCGKNIRGQAFDTLELFFHGFKSTYLQPARCTTAVV